MLESLGLLIKVALTIGLIGLLYAMGPCGWMIGGVGILYLGSKGY